MKKHGIPRRKNHQTSTVIDPVLLNNLYWNGGMSSTELGELFGVNGRTIRKKLRRHGIKRKTVSQARTTKKKKRWDGSRQEKAYLLGLRTGDFHAKKMGNSVRVQTSTTHPALKKLLRNAFRKWGEYREYYSTDHRRCDEWFIYVDLHESFEWLIEKPKRIPDWIFFDDICFYEYLAAYADCEAAVCAMKSRAYVRLTFSIKSGDHQVLQDLQEKLRLLGYTTHLYNGARVGDETTYGPFNINTYELKIYQQADLIRLYMNLLPLSFHSEKVDKYWFSLQYQGGLWKDVQEKWNRIIEGIKENVLAVNSDKQRQ